MEQETTEETEEDAVRVDIPPEELSQPKHALAPIQPEGGDNASTIIFSAPMRSSVILARMKNTMRKSQIPLPPLQTGQIWQMEGSHLKIGMVGKRLVHYKHFKGQAKRSPNSLSGKAVLEQFLRANKAVLVQAQGHCMGPVSQR